MWTVSSAPWLGRGRAARGSVASGRPGTGRRASGTYGTDTVVVPAGIFVLQRVPPDLRSPDTDRDVGDLDLRSNAILAGAGVGSTIIEGGEYRVGVDVTRDAGLEVHGGGDRRRP